MWQSKKGPEILLFDLQWSPDMPPGQNFCTTVFYSSLPLIWYATWLCLYKMDFGPFVVTPCPCPQGLHQNSECVPPVLIYRAITCDSFKVLAQKAYEELCDNQKKRTQNPTFWPLVTPRYAHHGFWTRRCHTPLALPQGVTSKFRMCSSSPHP